MKITKDIKTELVTYEELYRRVGDIVLANSLRANTQIDGDEWELINGDDCPCREHETIEECTADDCNCNFEQIEIYQEYVITRGGAEYLQSVSDEIVYYNEELDIYIWGVTHWGTGWDGVETLIKA